MHGQFLEQSGEFAAAAGMFEEANAIAEAAGAAPTWGSPYGSAVGDEEDLAIERIEAAYLEASSAGDGDRMLTTQRALAVLYNGLGGATARQWPPRSGSVTSTREVGRARCSWSWSRHRRVAESTTWPPRRSSVGANGLKMAAPTGRWGSKPEYGRLPLAQGVPEAQHQYARPAAPGTGRPPGPSAPRPGSSPTGVTS